MNRLIRIKRTTPKRAFILTLLCLFLIAASVLVMNLQTPVSIGSANKNMSEPPPSPIVAPPAEVVVKPAAPLPIPSTSDNATNDTPPNNPAVTGNSAAAAVTQEDLDSLRSKKLLIPVAGITVKELRDSFYDGRSEGRIHQALDIMAAEGTPVLASADGKIKLHTSERGGTMIYVTDLFGPYVYYYGHLQRYGDGIYDGKQVKRGDVIAYVGDTGNAGAGNFHLHFGIDKVSAAGKWSGGIAINPYPLLTGR